MNNMQISTPDDRKCSLVSFTCHKPLVTQAVPSFHIQANWGLEGLLIAPQATELMAKLDSDQGWLTPKATSLTTLVHCFLGLHFLSGLRSRPHRNLKFHDSGAVYKQHFPDSGIIQLGYRGHNKESLWLRMVPNITAETSGSPFSSFPHLPFALESSWDGSHFLSKIRHVLFRNREGWSSGFTGSQSQFSLFAPALLLLWWPWQSFGRPWGLHLSCGIALPIPTLHLPLLWGGPTPSLDHSLHDHQVHKTGAGGREGFFPQGLNYR